MDKMITHYATKRKTLRWLLAMFFNTVNIASLPNYVIDSETNTLTAKHTRSHRTFLQDLGKQLAIQERNKNRKFLKHFSTRSGKQGHQQLT